MQLLIRSRNSSGRFVRSLPSATLRVVADAAGHKRTCPSKVFSCTMHVENARDFQF